MIDIALDADRPIHAADVVRLNGVIGWFPERSQADYEAALRGGPAVGAWSGGELVGFARAISDGATHAYIDDVIVLPSRQREGIALRLVEALCHALADVHTVTLFCQEELAALYEKAQFHRTKQVVLHRRHRFSE